MMRNGDEAPGVKEEVFNMENDGLGAFRPSTSINDLTSILGGTDPLESTPQKATINQETVISETGSSGKKRGRNPAVNVVSVTTSKKKKIGASKNGKGQPVQNIVQHVVQKYYPKSGFKRDTTLDRKWTKFSSFWSI